MWFNALTIMTVFATAIGYVPDQQLAETSTNVLLVIAPLINLALRLVTHKGIEI